MKFPPRLQTLLQALRRLPGVGPKTAQRMAFHLIERDRDGAQALLGALAESLEAIGHCRDCRMFSEGELCTICGSGTRDPALVCVVESPADVIAIDEAATYRGLYYVLHGRLSPLDGVGPDDIGAGKLAERLAAGTIQEVILATSATVEGEATASYLAGIARRHGLRVTRIAHGVPIGGELEYVDSGTLSRAIAGRVTIED